MIPQGKGILIWKGVNYGSLAECVQACQAMGLRWVGLKIGDAADDRYRSFPDMTQAVAAFRAAGIKIVLWHYLYGGAYGWPSPAEEARYAKGKVLAYQADAYAIDAEQEYKRPGAATYAGQFMTALQGIGVDVGLLSYRFPSYHPEFPWSTFLSGCTFHMPQVYYGPGRAIIDINRSTTELTAKRALPIVPVGRAYIGDGYGLPGPSGAEITSLLQRSVELGQPGAGAWALDFLRLHTGGAARQAAIAAFQWPGDEPPPATLEERFDYLENWMIEYGGYPGYPE